MGVATGCGFKEIYRFPHTTYPGPAAGSWLGGFFVVCLLINIVCAVHELLCNQSSHHRSSFPVWLTLYKCCVYVV